MKAFKFACPVCGQHINADADATGSQIECPTCFQKIVIPQAPSSEDGKFILSAAQVRKARPTGVPEAGPAVVMQRKVPWMAIAAGVVLVAGGAAAIVFRDAIFKSKKTDEQPALVEKAPAPVSQPAPAPIPVVADERWKMDLTEIAFPDTPVVGKIHGVEFTAEEAYLQNGSLILRQGKGGPSDMSIAILLAKQGQTMGQHFSVNPTMTGAPKVTVKWKKDNNSTSTASFTEGYALKLELGYLVDGKEVSGQIYLCTPDDAKSFVCGTFKADFKKPKPKK